jgi:hypothetical protein
MNGMFGISPERALYINDGCSPSDDMEEAERNVVHRMTWRKPRGM